MNILFVCPKPPWTVGGIERVVGEIARRLVNENDITIFCKDKEPKEITWHGVTVNTCRNEYGLLSSGMM